MTATLSLPKKSLQRSLRKCPRRSMQKVGECVQNVGTWTTWTGALPWWYTVVPGKLLRHQELMLVTAMDFFSFGILLRTLFQPWKRDEISTERLSLQERFAVWGLNFISRLFGFLLRMAAMVMGLITLVVLFLFFFFLWVTWLIAPLMAGGLLVLGLMTMFGAFS